MYIFCYFSLDFLWNRCRKCYVVWRFSLLICHKRKYLVDYVVSVYGSIFIYPDRSLILGHCFRLVSVMGQRRSDKALQFSMKYFCHINKPVCVFSWHKRCESIDKLIYYLANLSTHLTFWILHGVAFHDTLLVGFSWYNLILCRLKETFRFCKKASLCPLAYVRHLVRYNLHIFHVVLFFSM